MYYANRDSVKYLYTICCLGNAVSYRSPFITITIVAIASFSYVTDKKEVDHF